MNQRRAPWSEPALRWSLDTRVRHLNHGSFGAVPIAVQEEQERLRAVMDWNPVRWFATMPERIAEARLEMAQLLCVDPATMAFVHNASAGASVVYQSLLDRGRVDVLVTDHGYGAITMGAQRLAARTGGKSHCVKIPLSATAAEVTAIVGAAIDCHSPDLLVIDQITSATARAFPVDAICRLARERGTLTLVDGAHAPGVLADPVCYEADYWVGNLHKFACSARGAAVIVARDGGDELHPLIDSWGAGSAFPERFDHNGTMDLTAWLTAPFAWRHIDEGYGWDAVRSYAGDVLEMGSRSVVQALEALSDVAQPDVGQPVPSMRLIGLPMGLAENRLEADALRVPFSDETGIALAFTSFGGLGYARLSAHVYNTVHDYTYLAEVGIPLLHRWSLEQNRGTKAS